MNSEYLCLVILPESIPSTETVFERFEFKHHCKDECSYDEYVSLLINLCQSNLALIDYNNYCGCIDVLIRWENCESNVDSDGDVLCIDAGALTPFDAFSLIIETFSSDSTA